MHPFVSYWPSLDKICFIKQIVWQNSNRTSFVRSIITTFNKLPRLPGVVGHGLLYFGRLTDQDNCFAVLLIPEKKGESRTRSTESYIVATQIECHEIVVWTN
jgi:hypothetical protein